MPGTVTENTILSSVKEMEIEQVISSSAEFRECESQIKSKNPQQIQECFRNKLNGKSKEQLDSLTEKLGLMDYKLIKGETSKEVTQYLADRLYKAMKGVDRSEERFLSFKNKKLVDQREYFDLYRTQLTKSALFEISRFCFLHFRYDRSTATNFSEYWQRRRQVQNPDFNDLGNGFSDSGDLNTQDKAEIYTRISQNIGTNKGLLADGTTNTKAISDVYKECVQQIGKLCQRYEENRPDDKNGQKACLTKARMIDIKRAVAQTDKVLEEWGSGARGGFQVNMSLFQAGSTSDNSIDALTNYSSADFLARNENASENEIAQKCSSGELEAESPECERFILNGDLRVIEENAKVRSQIRDEIEIARLKKLVETNDQNLTEYLRVNGYADLLREVEAGNQLTSQQIEEVLGKKFQARRDAMVAALDDRLTRRQVRTNEPDEDDPPASASPGPNTSKVSDAAKEFLEERARLSQVVMFNNIITSHLSLSKEDKTDLGRNINILKKEVAGLEENSINQSLFQNLKEDADSATGTTENFSSISLDTFIDPILDPSGADNPAD